MKIPKYIFVPLLVVATHFASGQGAVTFNPVATGSYSIQTVTAGGTLTGGYSYSGGYASSIGEYYAPGGTEDILTFQLPSIPVGNAFTGASLYNELYGFAGGTPANADLYALGISATIVVDGASQYYQGPADPNPNATLIEQNYLTPTSGTGTPGGGNADPITTTVAAGTTLTTYLNALDVNNSAAGEYLTLRVSYDLSTITSYADYQLLNEGAGNAVEQPALTLDYASIPEPSTYALMGFGGLGMWFFVRRKKTRIA